MRFTVRLLVAALLLFSTAQVFAQATATGTIRGTVTDASGAVVSGAQVTITNTGTSVARSATSGTTGGYVFDQLPPGNYSVKVTKSGFAASVTKLDLLVGHTATTNFALKPGSVDQVVEVTSAAPIIDVEKTSVSQQVT
ncbi:MAG TPA: carboxypeptidase-like regulatory domain-containing protein, partial [Terriglobales bacterium]